jgi:hypothetical protein
MAGSADFAESYWESEITLIDIAIVCMIPFSWTIEGDI